MIQQIKIYYLLNNLINLVDIEIKRYEDKIQKIPQYSYMNKINIDVLNKIKDEVIDIIKLNGQNLCSLVPLSLYVIRLQCENYSTKLHEFRSTSYNLIEEIDNITREIRRGESNGKN